MKELWNKREVAKRLKEIRNSLNKTQEDMAELLEISIQTYKNMESGKGNISNATLRKMKEKINFSTDYLLFGEKGDFIEVWNHASTLKREEQLLLLLKLFQMVSAGEGPAMLYEDEEKNFDILRQLAGAGHDGF